MEIPEILALDFESSYKLLGCLQDRYPNVKSVLTEVRFGFDIKFDIYQFFSGQFTPKPKSGIIILSGISFPQNEFYTEIEKREFAVKRALISSLTDLDILEPRS